MKKIICLFILSAFLSGCATISSIEGNARSINYSDGVSRKEAKVIAKKQIIQTDFKKNYRVINPKVYDASELGDAEKQKELFLYTKELYSDGKLRYPNSWYVVFRPKFSSLFSVYYLVVIDKNFGQVQYAQEENAIAALGQLVSSELKNDASQSNDALQSAVVAARYYSENGRWPSNSQELQEYFEAKATQQKQEKQGEHLKINFKDLQLEQTPQGHLLINVKEDEKKEAKPLYEIQPLGNDEFIVNYGKDITRLNYVLKIKGEKITVNPSFKEDKNKGLIESLATLFSILGIPSK